MDYHIRDMLGSDIEAKGFVHWKSWHETYKGLIDTRYLEEHVTLERRIRAAHRQGTANTLVALVDGKVVGFCTYDVSQDGDLENCGEIGAFYVLQAFQKQKIGYALMQEALKRLQSFDRVAVWVLASNENAIRFYKKVGFAKDGITKELNLGSTVYEKRMILDRTKASL